MAVFLSSNAVGCGHVGGFESFRVFWVPMCLLGTSWRVVYLREALYHATNHFRAKSCVLSN